MKAPIKRFSRVVLLRILEALEDGLLWLFPKAFTEEFYLLDMGGAKKEF